jgi:thiol-disulfide isomerase/thioredoxin
MARTGRSLILFVLIAFASGLPGVVVAEETSEERLAEAQRLLKQGKGRDAALAFRSANAKADGKCAECLLGLSSALMMAPEPEGSIQAAREAIALTEDPLVLMRAYNNVGNALYFQARQRGGAARQVKEAEEAFRKAIDMDENVYLPASRLTLAQLLTESRRGREAVPVLEELLASKPNASVAEQARALLARARLSSDPTVPEEVTFATLDGGRIQLRELAGKVVLLDFWATWCPPCRESLPGLKQLYASLREEPFELISISADQDRAKLAYFVKTSLMGWPQVWDDKQLLITTFGVRAFPTYILIDPQGKIVLEATGWSPRLEKKIRAEVGKVVRDARRDS